MMQRVGDWHGEEAAKAYIDWVESGRDSDLNRYLRHLRIADWIWKKYE